MKVPEIGDVVYRPFRPQYPGKIIKVIPVWYQISLPVQANTEGYTRYKVSVKFLNGKEEEIYWESLNYLNDLIEDHEKKLRTHKHNLLRCNEL
jgi:hypothetical protein